MQNNNDAKSPFKDSSLNFSPRLSMHNTHNM